MKRLKEIQDRKIEIRSILAENRDVDLDMIQKELESLEQEEKEIRMKQEIADKIKTQEIPTKTVEIPAQEDRKSMNDVFATPEYRKAFFDYVKTGVMDKEFRTNAFSTTAAASAGATIPTTTLNKIVEKIENSGMILPLVTRTAYQTGVAIPTSSVKPVATWVAERATSDIQAKTVGSVTFGAYKLRVAVGVSLEVDVLAIDALEQTIINNIADAIVKALEEAIISGSGTGRPKGIVTETPLTGQTVQAATLDYDTLISMEAALPAQYENGAVYVMSKATFLSLKAVKDDNKRPVIDPQDVINKTLLGRNVVLCDYLPSFKTASANDVVAFIFRMGDYILNTAYNVTLKTYEDDVTEDIVRKAIVLADGKVVDKNSLVTLVKSAS